MKKILKYIPSILFNGVELLIIFLIGTWLKVPLIQMLLIFALFVLVRISIGNPIHFKDWKKCMLWSTLIFVSLFCVAKVEIWMSIIMAAFSGFILTQKGDIQGDLDDIFMYKSKKDTKYDVIDEYIANTTNKDELKEFEERLRQYSDENTYKIYKIRFYGENKKGYPSLDEIESQTIYLKEES